MSQTIAQQIRSIRKGRTVKVKANTNVAAVTAHRAFGKGGYRISKHSQTLTKVTRVA